MENNNIKQGVTYGIVGGLIFLALLFGLWAVGSVENFVAVTGVTTFIPYLFIILLVVGFKLRKDNGGLYSFNFYLSHFAEFIYVFMEFHKRKTKRFVFSHDGCRSINFIVQIDLLFSIRRRKFSTLFIASSVLCK